MNSSNQNDWQPCQEGQLASAVSGMKARQRDRLMARAVGYTGAVIAMLFVSVIAVQQIQKLDDRDYGGITCAEVARALEPFAAGDLSPEQVEQIRDHLARCPKCCEVYEARLGEKVVRIAPQSAPEHEHGRTCNCAACQPQVAMQATPPSRR